MDLGSKISRKEAEIAQRGKWDLVSRPGAPLEKKRSRNVWIRVKAFVALWWRDRRREVLGAVMACVGMLAFLWLVGSIMQLFI